jgi:hypothetical protein
MSLFLDVMVFAFTTIPLSQKTKKLCAAKLQSKQDSSDLEFLKKYSSYTVRSDSHCALRLWFVDLVVGIEVTVEMCCCFTVFSC